MLFHCAGNTDVFNSSKDFVSSEQHYSILQEQADVPASERSERVGSSESRAKRRLSPAFKSVLTHQHATTV